MSRQRRNGRGRAVVTGPEAERILLEVLRFGFPKAVFFNDNTSARHCAYAATISEAELRAGWTEHGAELEATHPALCRPFGWWKFSAPAGPQREEYFASKAEHEPIDEALLLEGMNELSSSEAALLDERRHRQSHFGKD